MSISTLLASEVLGVGRKRLDNLLVSLREVLGQQGRQGRSRQLTIDTLEVLAVTLLLQRDLGVSARRGLSLAQNLRSSDSGIAPVGVLASLHFDMTRLRSVLHNALAEAVEDHSVPRRGRPTIAVK